MIVIAALGDAFILPAVWELELRKYLQPFVGEVKVIHIEVGWPDIPMMEDQEVKEFVGNADEIAAIAAEADMIVTHSAPVTQAVIERAKNLKIIGCCRGGPVNVNVTAATAHGIPVVFAPGRNAQAVVEFTLGMILAECKSIARAHRMLAQGIWQGELYRYDRAPKELQGSTIGLVGFGAIAQMLVPYLRPFQIRTLAFDPYIPEEKFVELGVEKTSLNQLLEQSDIVSLHARVTPETKNMMGVEQFARMKPGSYFINAARGPLVDYAALYDVLNQGHLAGAALDTFSIEPPPVDWPLLKLGNVTLTPHIAGSSKETAYRSAEIIAKDLNRFVRGEPLKHCANPQVFTKEFMKKDGKIN